MEYFNDCLNTDHPISELIFNCGGNNNKLLARISFSINGKYNTITFICDTGAPMWLYLSNKAYELLKPIIMQDEFNNLYIITTICNEIQKIEVQINSSHNESNIIGLLLLNKLGLSINNNIFQLQNLPKYL